MIILLVYKPSKADYWRIYLIQLLPTICSRRETSCKNGSKRDLQCCSSSNIRWIAKTMAKHWWIYPPWKNSCLVWRLYGHRDRDEVSTSQIFERDTPTSFHGRQQENTGSYKEFDRILGMVERCRRNSWTWRWKWRCLLMTMVKILHQGLEILNTINHQNLTEGD